MKSRSLYGARASTFIAMTRVSRRAASAGAARISSRNMTRTKFRKHKVIMESITQEKKKLRSVISFEAKAPPGYTFILAGNPHLTSACKDMCRNDGLEVFAVTTTPHQRVHGLSQQVHRIGYHFPSAVVATVFMELGLYLTTTGKVLPFEDIGNNHPSRRADSEISQTTINTEARDVIRDLFPNVPDKDLNQIIKTAFQKGQRKVGTAVELPLARRAQLAVVAHIRHIYTEYDRLLKLTSFQEARALVEDSTLEKLVHWRGDDENGKTELEDVFREVIVISDDDDNDSDTDCANGPTTMDRDSSVEIVSRNAFAGELQTGPVNYAGFSNETIRDLSDEEALPGYCYVPETPQRRKTNKAKVDRRGFSRYQAWDRARDRYRERLNGFDHDHLTGTRVDRNLSSRIPQQQLYSTISGPPKLMHDHQVVTQQGPIPNPNHDSMNLRRVAPSDTSIHRSEQSLHGSMEMAYPAPIPQRSPNILQFSDGSVFQKMPAHVSKGPLPCSSNTSCTPVFISGPSSSTSVHWKPRKRMHASGNLPTRQDIVDAYPLDHIILPSIEVPESPVVTRLPGGQRTSQMHNALDKLQGHSPAPFQPPVEDLSRRINVIQITNNRNETLKRRHLEYHEIPYDPASSPRNLTRPIYAHSSERSERQHTPVVSHSSQLEQILDDDPSYRVQAIRPKRPQTARHLSERIPSGGVTPSLPLESRIPYPMAHCLPRPGNQASSDPFQCFNSPSHRSPVHSHLDSLSYRRSHPAHDDSDVNDRGNGVILSGTQPLYARGGNVVPVVYDQAQETGLDSPAWRSKVSAYDSQRRHIHSHRSSWPIGMRAHEIHSPRALHPSVHERDIDHITTLRSHTPKIMEHTRDGVRRKREFSLHQYPLHPASQAPAVSLDGVDTGTRHATYSSRAKESLPSSAVRRYEVQLEKSLDPIRYASKCRRVLQTEHKPHTSPYLPTEERSVIVID